ncbi:MAG: TRAP transporter TatT component family protein, partial [Desulfomonilia bacterium]
FLGIDVPDKQICPEHNSPLNYLWHGFNCDARASYNPVAAKEAWALTLEFFNTLDESYNNGTAHAVLGTLYANRPKAEGGDPEKAKEQFDKAFTYSGNSVFTIHVMYAKFYACRIQDRELFKKTLEQVIGTPANTYVDKTFVNEVARRKAKVLLEHIDTYFKVAETKKKSEAGTTP